MEHVISSANTKRVMSNFLHRTFTMNKRMRNRLIEKDGRINLSWQNVAKQRQQYVSDLFTSLVEVRWRWCALMFAVSFLLSWMLFAVFYYLTQLAHGDFNNNQWANNSLTCIVKSKNFLSCFFFSLEAQSTIGFGARYPTVNTGCWAMAMLLPAQTIIGVALQTLMAGIVFAKIARPLKRAQTIIFSRRAVIEMVDGKLCLLFRVGDMRTTQLAEAHVRLQMVCNKVTSEGELYPFHQSDMNVGYDTGNDRLFLVWPITISHVINEQSPLYELGKKDLENAVFEVVAILEGVVQSTGSTMHARTSYLATEIEWGYRFEKLLSYQRDDGKYRINFEKFNCTYEVSCPDVSAKKIDEMKKAGLYPEQIYAAHGLDEIENEGRTPYDTLHPGAGARRPSVLDYNLLAEKITQLEGGGSLSDSLSEVKEENEETESRADNKTNSALVREQSSSLSNC